MRYMNVRRANKEVRHVLTPLDVTDNSMVWLG